jgi:hypothetical protein
MGSFEFAFNNPKYSDRVLRLIVSDTKSSVGNRSNSQEEEEEEKDIGDNNNNNNSPGIALLSTTTTFDDLLHFVGCLQFA